MHILCSGGRHFKLQLGNLDSGLQIKASNVKYRNGFREKSSRLLKVRNEVIREKIGVTQTVLERMENNALKWYRHVVCMEDKRSPKQIMTYSPRRIRKP
jgi:hypothetical protein